MTVYETPNEPTGLVYDTQGNKWRKDENYRFECSYPGHTGLRVWPAIEKQLATARANIAKLHDKAAAAA